MRPKPSRLIPFRCRPPVLVLGLGYENDKAIGAVEYIEPAAIWAFEPTGHDERYSKAIRQANKTLWDVLPQEKRLLYSVYHPFDCFVSLESLTYGLVRESRPILVPFGPKLFAVCCLLVSFAHPMVSVWRVSSGHLVWRGSIPTNEVIWRIVGRDTLSGCG